MSAAEIAIALGGAVRHGRGWLCRCPVAGHGQGGGDRTPSLSLGDGEAGQLLALPAEAGVIVFYRWRR